MLHIGCGAFGPEKLPPLFRGPGWREIRLDIDPGVQPDVIASITDMRVVGDGMLDAVYSSHNIEHLYPHEVPVGLAEIARVLKPAGFAFFRLPDIQEVARHVADGRLEDPLYMSTMGPISAIDILFGHRPAMAAGNIFMAHHMGFTNATLASALITAGFAAALVQRHVPSMSLNAIAFKRRPTQENLLLAQAQMAPDWPTVIFEPAV